MDNPILSVDFKHEYNNVSDKVTYSARACVDMDAIQNGLIKKVGANRLPLLLVILSHMDKDGKAFPSQRKLAELSGQSVNTVNKLINELLEIEVDGQKLLRRELVGNGAKKKSMYFIHQGEVTNTDAIKEVKKLTAVEAIEAETKTMNSRDVADYFADVYKETFGVGYTFNYGRDLSMIKKKLIPNYADDAIKGLIDVAVKNYKSEWANDNYPLPTVSMLCTWLANTAYGKWKQGAEKVEQFEDRKAKAVEQDDTDRALDLFDI
jgi:DNA-binding transcriptional regulator YhcF (GntR family)